MRTSIATLLDNLSGDLLYAVRTMRNSPAFTLTALTTLAVGIGANAAIFSAVHAVLLKPLDYHDPDRLVQLSGGASLAHFEEIKNGRSFSGVGAFAIGMESLTLSGGAEPEVLKAARVSSNFLGLLGVQPVLGRSFLPEEEAPGGAPVVIVSAELWQRRFSRDPNLIGKSISLGNESYTVVGVLPTGFDFPFEQADLWVTKPAEWSSMPAASRQLSPFLTVFGRLKPGVNLDQASAELNVIQHRYASAHPAMLDAKPKAPVRAKLWKESLISKVRSILWMLFGAVAFVLAIACANIAGLSLARATVRSRELAIRSALGASRKRLVIQMLIESVLLSVMGGSLGILFAYWVLRTASHVNALSLPRADGIHLNAVVLGFTVAISIATGILFGLAPAQDAARLDLMRVLRVGNEAIGRSTERLRRGLTTRNLLVVCQVALSVVLLIGASLLVQTVVYLRSVSPGFHEEQLLTARIALPPQSFGKDQKKTDFFRGLLQRVALIPGVQDATAALTLPMTPFPGTPVQDAAKPRLRLNERPIATALIVMPGYFRTLEIPFRRGRDFTERDEPESQRVAIIDEKLASRFWPSYPNGENPVGQHLLVGGINPHPAEIVGIVAHVHQSLEDDTWQETVYTPFAQNAQTQAMIAVRTRGNPLHIVSAVRREVHALDRDQAITAVQTMNDLIDSELGQRRSFMLVLGTFAVVAVLLATIGLYGLISYSVVRRTRELGVRRALGASEADIVLHIIKPAFGLTLMGVITGVAGALALTRLLQNLLFHVSATDPATFIEIAVLLIIVALAASYFPARRATRVDPMLSLRAE